MRSLDDLDGMRMGTTAHPDDTFLAAGVPWYLTLFGRDSIWAARMLLPLDLGPAAGTLRALARLQGTKINSAAAEEPGKIPHELRRAAFELGGMTLPPLYYGTIDATPLWICLLHDAWRAGLADAEVVDLLPALERALTWLTDVADSDGDGFLNYLDASGRGLANQGWKDSADAIRFHDGRIAEGSIALCEVQGYAYEAAISGATLLESFGRPGADRLRGWAADLAERFRAAFWCGDGETRFPALALDGRKRRVDSLTSNIGHLLGTGLLNGDEERLVAVRMASAELDSGLGLRTMSAADAGLCAAELSLRVGVAARHGHRDRRTASGRAGRVRGRADRGPAARVGRLRPASAGIVERRGPSGAVSGGLPPASLVGRVGGRGGTGDRGTVNTEPVSVDLVAAIDDGRLRVERSDHGLVLPQITGSDGWSDPPQILEVARDATGMIMVPAVLIESDPRSVLHVVTVAGGPSNDEWIDLDDLDQLAHPPVVAEAIRRSVAEYRGSSARPAGRPDWFHPDWQPAVDAWIDDVLSGADVRRSGPSVVIKFWSLSAVVKVPVTGIRGDDAVFFKAACQLFRAEPALTRFVSGIAPESVPDLLAVDTERGWMLMRAFEHDDA